MKKTHERFNPSIRYVAKTEFNSHTGLPTLHIWDNITMEFQYDYRDYKMPMHMLANELNKDYNLYLDELYEYLRYKH